MVKSTKNSIRVVGRALKRPMVHTGILRRKQPMGLTGKRKFTLMEYGQGLDKAFERINETIEKYKQGDIDDE